MSLIVANCDEDYDEVLVCHVNQWNKSYSDQLALDHIGKGRYKNTSLLPIVTNSEEIYQKLNQSVEYGDTVTLTFNVPHASRVGNYFVPISRRQLEKWTKN